MTSFEHARPAQNDTSTFKTKYHNMKFLQYDHLFCLLVKYLKNINTPQNYLTKKATSTEPKLTNNNQMVANKEQNVTSNKKK